MDPLDYSGDEDEMGDALEVDDHQVNVVRYILSTALDNDEWKRTKIFHTYFSFVSGGRASRRPPPFTHKIE